MERTLARRTRALLTAGGVALLALTPSAARATTAASRWDVTVAVHVSGGTGAAMGVRLALPADSDTQQIGAIEVTARGLEVTVVRDALQPAVDIHGDLTGARRIAVRYAVYRTRELAPVPAVQPVLAPAPELVPFLGPSPLFQSRSILVREFLESYVSPLLGTAGNTDLMRAIFQATREHLLWDRAGKTLTLDVIRSGKGKRIGIERAFTTFLRSAHIPARLVEGMNLNSTTRRKRVFWTEVWAQNRWWPVSASRGWIGREPQSYVAVTRNGQHVLTVEGPVTATYSVQAIAADTKP